MASKINFLFSYLFVSAVPVDCERQKRKSDSLSLYVDYIFIYTYLCACLYIVLTNEAILAVECFWTFFLYCLYCFHVSIANAISKFISLAFSAFRVANLYFFLFKYCKRIYFLHNVCKLYQIRQVFNKCSFACFPIKNLYYIPLQSFIYHIKMYYLNWA